MDTDGPTGALRPGSSESPGWSPASDVPGSVLLGRTRLPSNLGAPRAARAAIKQWMPASMPRTVLQDAQLLISELVSNSVEHAAATAGTPISVSAGTIDGVVWFEVADAGGGGAVSRRPAKTNGGMGLNMVDAAASRWGTSDGDGTQVWFELEMLGPR